MSRERKNTEATKKKTRRSLKRDPRNGYACAFRPSYDQKQVAKDFPEDSDRDAIILRRSVGL
ncbi:MAG TPA: hypothetical protein VKA08_19325 [Balneolales bacterium]|nr:hypothetical protein [Balneolales bacterium]